MANTSEITANNVIRTETVNKIMAELANANVEALLTASNKIAIPTINSLGTEIYVVLTISIPKGSRDGEAYDGYAEAENYRLETKQKQDEKIAKEAAKQKKIERDKKLREEKAKLKKEKETE